MARELITRIWCDICINQGEHNEGKETEPVTIGNLKPRVLALCEEHWEMYEQFRTTLAELGQIHDTEVRSASPVRKRQSQPSLLQPPFICRVPGCSAGERPLKNRGSLQAHIRNQHGLLTNEYTDKYLTEEQP